jgi:hypothetical protein
MPNDSGTVLRDGSAKSKFIVSVQREHITFYYRCSIKFLFLFLFKSIQAYPKTEKYFYLWKLSLLSKIKSKLRSSALNGRVGLYSRNFSKWGTLLGRSTTGQ